jgi:hypothetical protein
MLLSKVVISGSDKVVIMLFDGGVGLNPDDDLNPDIEV